MSLKPRPAGRPPKHPCVACGRGVGRSRRCARCGAAQRVRAFQVEAVLATGPRGRVYRARSADGGALVLKELAFATVPDVHTLELFGRECEALRRLSHPRIPRFIDGFQDGAGAQLRFYLAQTLLPGEDLEQRLARHSFDEADARAIARDVLDVLAYLHTRSPIVVHRDVKPANVLALEDGRYGLVDFGLARSGADLGGASVAGTFGYLPPEQLFRHADERSDLYALGMTLCRLLSRKRPEELLTPGLEVHFETHVNVSRAFAGFLHRLVARDPARRFLSAAHALEALAPPVAAGSALTVETPVVRAADTMMPGAASMLRAGTVKSPSSAEPSVLIPLGAMGRPERRAKVIVSPEVFVAPSAAAAAATPSESPGVARGIPWRVAIGGRTFLLQPGRSHLMGREEDCALRIDDQVEGASTVSRHHLRLTVGRFGLTVEELGSRNGTWVGRHYIRPAGEQVVVREGVELQLGEVLGEVVPAFLVVDASPRDRPLSEARRRRAARPDVPKRIGYLGGDPEGVRVARIWWGADGALRAR